MTARAGADSDTSLHAWRKGALGTYALAFGCDSPSRIRIGSLGSLAAERGLHVYVGSAFGPGGLRARVGRHARRRKARRWHVDYLRERLRLLGVWYSTSSDHLEHEWAGRLLDSPFSRVSLARFGASDCTCESHLFTFTGRDVALRRVEGALSTAQAGGVSWLSATALRREAARRRE